MYFVNLETGEKVLLFESKFYDYGNNESLKFQDALFDISRDNKDFLVITTLECNYPQTKDTRINSYVIKKEFDKKI